MAKYNIVEKKEKDAVYRTLISPKLMDELKEKILDVILIQKKYKDKGYSAKRLAEDLGTNTRYISAVVNVRFHMNYTAFVNKYRVEEAMSLLSDKRYKDLNMEDVSDIVGFANRQSFYAAFFKQNGCTPRDYKVMHMAADDPKPKKRGRKPKALKEK
ncbi:helix-turn-helix domain-containing protein [Prevotella sp.]|uniref:helix-turn-helix domain-containing protein n=1 Tax=Prevotella sp. TaxID=59823 RepID=UPI002F947146